MQAITDVIFDHWHDLIVPSIVAGTTLLVGWILKRLLFRGLHRWAARTATDLDDIFIGALQRPFMLWVLILGIHLALQASALPPRLTGYTGLGLLILWVLSLTIVGASLAANLVRRYGPALKGEAPMTTLSQHLVRAVVWSLGLLIVLNTLGVSITPVLTALGVGGLAVALALQETLANLIAGFYVSVAGHVRVGDYIRLDSGVEGFVADISWRATTIRALADNLIIVPNAKLAQATVTNFTLPSPRMAIAIPVSVSFDSDPDRVERVLLDEVVRAVGQVDGLEAEPAPVVRFNPGFGASSLDFTVMCHVAGFTDQFPVQHALRKRFLARLRAEGIRIPFPTRTIRLDRPPSV